MEDSTTHGITADSTIHGSTEDFMIRGITADSIAHGTTADSTDRTITDGMEDGTRSGPDITMDTTLSLTTMAKTYGEVRDTRPALTEYLQAVHHQGEASVRPQPYAERLAAAQQRAYPEHQLQAARQPEGLQSEQLRQQELHQQYEEQLARAALQQRQEQVPRHQEATTADLLRRHLQEAERPTGPECQALQEAA